MKLLIEKNSFLKSWQMAERTTGSKSTVSILAGIRCLADETGLHLEATDLKTSLKCRAEGAEVQEPGETILPTKAMGELFKKAPGDRFSLEVTKGRATLTAGRSRYTLTVLPVEEFPLLPRSESARLFCDTTVQALSRLFEEGTFAGSPNEEFPQYLSAALLQIQEGKLKTVATDGRRLSLSQTPLSDASGEGQLLLPLNGLRELHRLLSAVESEAPVRILEDDSQAYFQVQGVEFSIRRVDSSFPPYEKILLPERTSWMMVGRSSLEEALERANVVVRDFTKSVILQLTPGGSLRIRGQAPDIGEAREELAADIDGEPLRVAFNISYLLDGIRALRDEVVELSFNGSHGQMRMSRPGEESFLYVLMPITLSEEESDDDEV
ncbi:MAG: DNA polymerase III subunit beta [Synergistales bacterium]|nr:DNA polymerase III subunit beta [Synergistales bacterium]